MIDKTSNHSGSEEELYELQHTWYLPVENITDRNATTLYIGVMDAGRTLVVCCLMRKRKFIVLK